MPEVFQIIGSILLLVVGVGVILYVLFRKSPVKTAEPEDETADETEDEAEETDDIPEGDAPAQIEREGEEPERAE